MPTLRPFRDYDEHDVINLFSWSGAVPAYKGTMVKIASPSGFVASEPLPGSDKPKTNILFPAAKSGR